ncbi:MAG: hypothetical protein Q8L48_25195 [Archangium sp.]|nr:hypothetical protein [Archangium sp.]
MCGSESGNGAVACAGAHEGDGPRVNSGNESGNGCRIPTSALTRARSRTAVERSLGRQQTVRKVIFGFERVSVQAENRRIPKMKSCAPDGTRPNRPPCTRAQGRRPDLRSASPAMFSLHCTARLLKVLRAPTAISELPAPTTRLGNWYANLLPLRRRPVVLCMSERSLLSVLLPAGVRGNIPRHLADELGTLLSVLGIPSELIEQERFAMAQSVYAKTSSRSVLGAMNEFAFAVSNELEDGSEPLQDLSLWLAGTIIKSSYPNQTMRVSALSDGDRRRSEHGR